METSRLTALIRYPLKSGRGEPLAQAVVGARGLQHDRRWVVVDAEGGFLSARTHPDLLGVWVEAGADGALVLSAEDQGACIVSAPPLQRPLIPVTVWDDATWGRPLGPEADAWMSARLGEACRVVFMPDTVERPVDPERARPGDVVSFADGFPLLLTNQASLAALNAELDDGVPMICFRPNLVVAGFDAFAEQRWSRVRVGALELENGGPCVRCQLTTRDPRTGVRRDDGEPLRTLARGHRVDGKVVFGINLIPRTLGSLSVGDLVEVLA